MSGGTSALQVFFPVSCHPVLPWPSQLIMRSDHQMHYHRCVFLITVSLFILCFFQTVIYYAAGSFPVIKQEQLSPRSSSSQADNLSTQGAPHDSAAGRGGWLTFSSLFYLFSICSKLVLVLCFCIFLCPVLCLKNENMKINFYHVLWISSGCSIIVKKLVFVCCHRK